MSAMLYNKSLALGDNGADLINHLMISDIDNLNGKVARSWLKADLFCGLEYLEIWINSNTLKVHYTLKSIAIDKTE